MTVQATVGLWCECPRKEKRIRPYMQPAEILYLLWNRTQGTQ